MRIGVLALQGDFEAHGRILRSLGAEPVEVRVPEDLSDLDALIIPGGESTVMSLGIEREGLAEPIRELAKDGTPVLGTCAGWPRRGACRSSCSAPAESPRPRTRRS